MTSSTANRDTLYRCLYLRREYAALQARAALQAEEQEKERLGLGTAVPSTSSPASPPLPASSTDVDPSTEASASLSSPLVPTTTAIPLDDLRDILLLPPSNAAMSATDSGDPDATTFGLRSPSPCPVSHSGIGGGGGGGGGGARSIGKDPMLREECGWAGLVFIRNLPSPWYNGCFPFTVYFPSRYPFEAPIIELGAPLRSHPHVQEGRVRDLEELGVGALGASMHTLDAIDTPMASSMTKTSASSLFSTSKRYFIPFDDVYCTIDPMRISVLSRVLQHVKRFFYPTEWPAAWQQPLPSSSSSQPQAGLTSPSSQRAAATPAVSPASFEPYVNRVLARRDVDRRSATQEVVLGKPYVAYLGTDVLQHFLAAWEQHAGAGLMSSPAPGVPSLRGPDVGGATTAEHGEEDEGALLFASWYNRAVLPHVLALP